MAIISHKVEGVANDVTHYTRIFPVNKKGHAQSELDGQIASALTNAFPTEPTEYILLETVTASQTWTAPADGYYQIDVHGGTGKGGNSYGSAIYNADSDNPTYDARSGGGSGGSAYASSLIKMNKGDQLEIVCGTLYQNTTVSFNSSFEDYTQIVCSSSTAGRDATSSTAGVGGAGGTASGGNHSNINGGSGKIGSKVNNTANYVSGGSGGSPAHTEGNYGTSGARAEPAKRVTGSAGKTGFVKILAGNTNAA